MREPSQPCSGAARKSEVPEESSSHAYRAISKVHMILTFPPFLTHLSTSHDYFLGSSSNTLCEPQILVLVLGSAFWGTQAEISGTVVASSISVWTNFQKLRPDLLYLFEHGKPLIFQKGDILGNSQTCSRVKPGIRVGDKSHSVRNGSWGGGQSGGLTGLCQDPASVSSCLCL